jgi:hypothetical protein
VSRILSPRRAFPLFRGVVSRVVATQPGPVEIAAENPDRVVIAFANGSGPSTAIRPAGQASSLTDIVISSSGYREYTNQLHGPLTQCAWSGVGGAPGAQLLVIEVILQKFPGEE